ncbi:MAG: alpha/beta hydrolase [Spirochaetia bacterium]
MRIKNMKIKGLNNRRITFTRLQPDEETGKTAIVLPGYSYSGDAPILFYTKYGLAREGYTVYTVEYRYNEREDFMELDNVEKDKFFAQEQNYFCDQLKEELSFKKLLVIGKSLGTTAMTIWHQNTFLMENTDKLSYIWMTPANALEDVSSIIKETSIPSILIAGDRDQYYNNEVYREMDSHQHCRTFIVPGAGHILEDEKSVGKSIINIKDSVEFIAQSIRQAFI